jgi:hypothetical protein
MHQKKQKSIIVSTAKCDQQLKNHVHTLKGVL